VIRHRDKTPAGGRGFEPGPGPLADAPRTAYTPAQWRSSTLTSSGPRA
jgi:hypothetical protein